MKRLFGSKKEAPPAPTLDQASAGVGGRVDQLDEKIKKLDAELRGHKEKLKTAKGPTKQLLTKRAMDVLKRKRMYEQQRDQLAGQQFNIEQAGFAIESAKDTVTTVAAMKAASSQLKTQYKEINIDEIEDITDDLADMMEDLNEVNEAMGRSYANADDLDEADLEAELDLLEEEMEAEGEELESGATPSYLQPSAMPETPAGGLSNEAKEDEFGLPAAAQLG
jgi:charged multivesicular body protein 5